VCVCERERERERERELVRERKRKREREQETERERKRERERTRERKREKEREGERPVDLAPVICRYTCNLMVVEGGQQTSCTLIPMLSFLTFSLSLSFSLSPTLFLHTDTCAISWVSKVRIPSWSSRMIQATLHKSHGYVLYQSELQCML